MFMISRHFRSIPANIMATINDQTKRSFTECSMGDVEDKKNIKLIKTSNEKYDRDSLVIKHDKYRLVSQKIIRRLTDHEIDLLLEVKSSCSDMKLVSDAIKLRSKYKLCPRLPEDEHDSCFYVRDGLRWVYPYYYNYQANAKRRWLGRKLIDIIKEEFRDISDQDILSRFKSNKTLVKGEQIDENYILKDNDIITNLVHRHELPILASQIKIVHEDDDVVVVNKPPSIPIYPCGRFRWNSVTHIMRLENKLSDLRVCHRIDRLVSGILILAKSSQVAHRMEQCIKNHKVSKVYVCRVAGEFPLGNPEDDGEIEVDQPLEHIPGKIGITVVLPEGKPSMTRFKRLHYNGKTSAVLCKPQSGRMHQIRVHLQYLGHPIVNDGLYNSDAFGVERGKGGLPRDEMKSLSDRILAKHRADVWLMADSDNFDESDDISKQNLKKRDEVVTYLNDQERLETKSALKSFCSPEAYAELETRWPFDESKKTKEETCRDCKVNYHDPPPRNLFIYLHALSYSGPGFHYETPMPDWACDTWKF